ncbi:hypothetical protein [Rahnella sp. ChDrAdgB13]|uniref:hypothetical protein n=1 Tax=Rahnella sp. ChDrAdgB13 TaxID=1850581 RepID=UPI001AD88F51|nr:hypothetical protein [Rahnella sp. ChDrAdgB13]
MLIFNHPLKNVLSTVVGVTALFTSVGTFAASVSGTPQTATATIVLNEPVVFTHTLTATEGVLAGASSGVLATGNVTFSAGATDKIAYTFGEGTLPYSNIAGYIETYVYGTNNPENEIRLMLGSTSTSTGWTRHEADSLIPYMYTLGPVTDNMSSYRLSMPNINEAQASKADSYVVSVTAYAYTS